MRNPCECSFLPPPSKDYFTTWFSQSLFPTASSGPRGPCSSKFCVLSPCLVSTRSVAFLTPPPAGQTTATLARLWNSSSWRTHRVWSSVRREPKHSVNSPSVMRDIDQIYLACKWTWSWSLFDFYFFCGAFFLSTDVGGHTTSTTPVRTVAILPPPGGRASHFIPPPNKMAVEVVFKTRPMNSPRRPPASVLIWRWTDWCRTSGFFRVLNSKHLQSDGEKKPNRRCGFRVGFF